MNKQTWKHISEKSWQKITEWKVCKWTWKDFPVFEKELEILDKISPVYDGEKFSIPSPNLSPKAREIKRMLWRNERNLYKRKCDLTGKSMISVYSPEYEWKVYYFKDFYWDNWDSSDYQIEIDHNKTIKEQLWNFLKNIPKRSINLDDAISMENCDYCNYWIWSKDSYMCQTPVMSEKCFYSSTPLKSSYCIDTLLCEECENSYESIDCTKSYKLFYCQNVEESNECYFWKDLKNCNNCIWCIWLRWKKYYIFNKKVSKEEYEKKLSQIFDCNKSYEKFSKEFEYFKNKFLKKNLNNRMSENSYWEWIVWSKNIIFWKDCITLEDSFYCTVAWITATDLISCTSVWMNINNLVDCIWTSNSSKSWFLSFASWNNSFYLMDVRFSDNCLLSSWFQNQEYTIFNKKYKKSEYENIASKIIEKIKKEWIWWDFFPSDFSPFPYNDTIANDYYPVKYLVFLDQNKKIIKREVNNEDWEWTVYILESENFISKAVLDLGWEEKINIKWRTKENETEIPKEINVIKAKNLPENISEITNDILKSIIICKKSKRPFRIIEEELKFYKKYNLPLPRLHPEIRYQNRFNKRPKNNLFLKECNKCNKEVLSAWNNEKVICEECYLKETY